MEIDPTLEKPVQGAKHQALGGTQEVEKKLLHHLKKRQETELGQLGTGPVGGVAAGEAAGAGAQRRAVPRALRAAAPRRAAGRDPRVVRRRP